MGMGNRNQGQVYYDDKTGQYYTTSSSNPLTGLYKLGGNYRTYIGSPIDQNQPSKTVTDMLARAQAAAQNVNVPTMQSLFPGMGLGLMNSAPMANNPNLTGQFGAGRFLGQNASQFGNPASPMGGFAPMAGMNNQR